MKVGFQHTAGLTFFMASTSNRNGPCVYSGLFKTINMNQLHDTEPDAIYEMHLRMVEAEWELAEAYQDLQRGIQEDQPCEFIKPNNE